MKREMIFGLVGVLVGVLLAGTLRFCERPPGVEIRSYRVRDTVRVVTPGVDREVIRYMPFSRKQVPEDSQAFGVPDKTASCPEVPYVDSAIASDGRDTVWMRYAFPQRMFAWRWKTAPDTSITVRDSSAVFTREYVEDSKRFGIGPSVTYGWDPFAGTWRVTVGVAVTWHLMEWK